MKKILSLLALMVLSIGTTWAADTVDDLVAVEPGYVFIADNITSKGTAKLTKNTLYDSKRIFANTANSVSAGKGSSKIGGTEYLNSLRLKNDQDQLVFKVAKPCIVKFYTQSHSSRGIQVGSSAVGTQYGKQDASTTEWECTIPAAGLVYLSSYNGDFYFAGFEVIAIEKKVTFVNDAGWENVYAYAWNGTGDVSAAWPGDKLTDDGEGNFVWKTTGDPTNIIFNNGTGTQTADLEFKDGSTYKSTGRVVVLKNYTVTFKTDGGWDPVYAYAWTGEEKQLGNWPGTLMTKVSDGEWTITVSAEEAPANIIFNAGDGQPQTPDYEFEADKTYTYNLNTYTATFTTDAGWDKVYAYTWTTTGEGDAAVTTEHSGAFPGTELIAADGVYTYSIKAFAAPAKILFNGGDGSKQTLDMGFTDGRAYKWNVNPTAPFFAPEVSEDKIAAGTTVEVKDANGDVAATLTYGVEGGADFAAFISRPNEEYAAFKNYTAGNGENGTATSGTVYTIKPVYNGSITVAVWLNANKDFFIQEDGVSLAGFDKYRNSYGSSTAFTFNVKAGSEYKIYCTGSKLGFYGFDYKFSKDVTIGATEWATYSSAVNVDLTSVEGLTAYMVTGVEGNAVVLKEVKDLVPAGTGLLLNGAAAKYAIPVAATEPTLDTTGNLLKSGSGEVVGAIDGYTRYVLSEADGKAVFQCIWNDKDGTDVRPTIAIGKAYLEVPATEARTLYINGETTGINNVENAAQLSFGTVYNMAGQRVSQPTRGLYIMNGKKVVVK